MTSMACVHNQITLHLSCLLSFFFIRVQMHDYQGLCEIWVRGGSGASTLFINVSLTLCHTCNMDSKTSLTDHLPQTDHSPISIALFGSQTIVHTIPLKWYYFSLNRTPPKRTTFKSVPRLLELKGFYCIYLNK